MFIGIDFGTSFSQGACYDNGNVKVLETGGNYGTPSVFYYDEIQGEHVRLDAEITAENPSSFAGNLIRDVKMRLDETFNLDDKTFTSSEIIKSIYKEIITQSIENGKREYGEDKFQVDGIVISHPAKFSMQSIGLLADAARDCIDPSQPIKIVGTIKEPVAAALNYYHADPQPNGTNILVFDLGGGTCDLAIVTTDRKNPAEFDVVDSDMEKIGGRDWDKALIEYVIQQIVLKNKNESAIRNDSDYMQTIKKAVIEAKHDLTEYETATVRVNYKSEQYNIKITRQLFDSLTVDLLEKVLDKLDEVYERNAKIASSIKSIICVGGSSRMPQIKNGIMNRFPNCEVRLFQPEYSVVGGAAIFAERMIN
ncbi:MAG: Hsp70 family protein, partial [Clostridia bacterium]|nr:Hsp70 family protein [Clostridia bacterium]